MTVLQFPTPIPVTNGNLPTLKFMVTTDSLATLTAAGYLNSANMDSAVPMSNTDVVMALYNYNTQTTIGTFAIFTVAITSGNITLSAWADTSNVTLPTIANSLVVSTNTTGQLANLTGTAVNVGSLQMATGSSITLAKVNGTEATNAVTASGSAGLLTTSTLTTAGAGSYVITWTNTFITSTSVVLLTIAGGTNTTENVTLKCVPGSGSATLTIYNNTASTALNGTILMSYIVM
jgi:hypothetical protein